jgi:hypothetical protein
MLPAPAAPSHIPIDAPSAPLTFSADTGTRLRDAFERHERRRESGALLSAALDATCKEAHFRKLSAEELVEAVRESWVHIPRPNGITAESWSRTYYAALGKCITDYFALRARALLRG